jgi:hypothetical protein
MRPIATLGTQRNVIASASVAVSVAPVPDEDGAQEAAIARIE